MRPAPAEIAGYLAQMVHSRIEAAMRRDIAHPATAHAPFGAEFRWDRRPLQKTRSHRTFDALTHDARPAHRKAPPLQRRGRDRP